MLIELVTTKFTHVSSLLFLASRKYAHAIRHHYEALSCIISKNLKSNGSNDLLHNLASSCFAFLYTTYVAIMDSLPANLWPEHCSTVPPSPFLAAQPFVSLYNKLCDTHRTIIGYDLSHTLWPIAFFCISLLMLEEPHVIPYVVWVPGHDNDYIMHTCPREIKPLARMLWLAFYVDYLAFLLMEVYLGVPAYCAQVSLLATYPAPTRRNAFDKLCALIAFYGFMALLLFAVFLTAIVITFLGMRELALGHRRVGRSSEVNHEEKVKGWKMI